MEEEKLEFFKLEMLDRKIVFWMMDHTPDAIRSWVEQIETEYHRKGKKIDGSRLLDEIMIEVTN